MKPGIDSGWYGAKVDADQVRADWTAEGFSFGVFRDQPGQEWNDFIHSADEYVVVSEGLLEIEIDGDRHDAAPGDRARIPAGAMHSVRTRSPQGSVWYYGYSRRGRSDG